MDKAFDSVLCKEVDASVIAKTAKTIYGKAFRYTCLCCGEEVYLAAADSNIKSPHFRHRRGNNEIDCEEYLGKPGAIDSFIELRKSSKERVEFCFNQNRCTFEVCISLTEEELDDVSEKGYIMALYTSYVSPPFFSVPLNRSTIIPNEKRYFTITKYANDYYASFDESNTKLLFRDVMKKDAEINIFKVGKKDDRCKRNVSGILYTQVAYIAITENDAYINKMMQYKEIDTDGNMFSFITQGRKFYAVQFEITEAGEDIIWFLQRHHFSIETSESLTVLWPPVFTRDNTVVCDSDFLYVSASFDFIPHGNIDVEQSELMSCSDGVHKFQLNDQVTITEKNIEKVIVRERRTCEESIPELPSITYSDKYLIPEGADYFIFDKNGCRKLRHGTNVYLSNGDRIVGYKSGHIQSLVYPCPETRMDKESLLMDILKYHPQAELFEPDDFMEPETDPIILDYLENCYRNGEINSVIKQYIKEGLI